MDAKELRIGNYVTAGIGLIGSWAEKQRVKDQIFIIKPCSFQNEANGILYFSGIPLTEDWLVRFGFALHTINYSSSIGAVADDYYCLNGFGLRKSANDEWGIYRVYFNGQSPETIILRVKFLHTVQNFFALMGAELEVK